MTVLDTFAELSNKILIDGEFRASAASSNQATADPATESTNGEVAIATDEEVNEAVAIANRAQKVWNKTNGLHPC
jgi:acyl-CoA reductase-like NAD-dependent aldehyde dehydrogenase